MHLPFIAVFANTVTVNSTPPFQDIHGSLYRLLAVLIKREGRPEGIVGRDVMIIDDKYSKASG